MSEDTVLSVDLDCLKGGTFEPFRDRLRENADLSKTNWFRVGGPARWLFRPQDVNDLSAFLKVLPKEIPVLVLGVGSNVIIRDGGIDGVVIRLGRGLADINTHEDHGIVAGAGALALNVAMVACESEISGMEFLSGIPGTLGGVVRMNGGAYGDEASGIVQEIQMVLRDGTVKRLKKEEIGFSYRHTDLPDDAIVTEATLKGKAGNGAQILERMKVISEERELAQPVRTRTGGSTFKNPPNQKAWELIDRAGCRGMMVGGAQMSEKHCNFIINTGDATAADLENLAEKVRTRVREVTNVELEWEIKRIGKPKP